MSNIYVIIQSRTIVTFNDDASRMHTDRICKGKKYFIKGTLGERINKSTGILEVVSGKKKD